MGKKLFFDQFLMVVSVKFLIKFKKFYWSISAVEKFPKSRNFIQIFRRQKNFGQKIIFLAHSENHKFFETYTQKIGTQGNGCKIPGKSYKMVLLE